MPSPHTAPPWQEALEELKLVQARAPREAPVCMLMGRVCKRLGRVDEAVRYFDYARDLDPKDANQVKRALDKLHLADMEEEVEL